MADAIETPLEAPAQIDADAGSKSLSDYLTTKVEGYKNAPELEQGPEPEKEEHEEEKPKVEEDEVKSEEPKKEPEEEEEVKEEEEETEEKKEEEEPKKEETKSEGEPEVGKPVPYERFQEVTRERTQLRSQLEEISPMVQSYHGILDYCQKNAITPEQFQEVLSTQALINSNPDEALKKLLPIVEHLQGFVGNRLPEDLQKRVDDGKIEFEDAKEIARLRAHKRFDENRLKWTQEQHAKRAQQEMNQQYVATAQQWEQAKRAADPDYRPSEPGKPDGLWEDVRDKFLATLNSMKPDGTPTYPVSTPYAMQQLMEQCYKAVKEKWALRLTPKKSPTRKTINGSQASSVNTTKRVEDADSLAEAVQIHLSSRK